MLQNKSNLPFFVLILCFCLAKSAMTMAVRSERLTDIEQFIDYYEVAKSPDHFGLELLQVCTRMTNVIIYM